MSEGNSMDVALVTLIACFFVFGLPIIFLIYYMERVDRPRELAKASRSKGVDNVPERVKEREVIVKEIVMIPCRYCGGLVPQTAVFCPNCGAKRKA